MDQMVAGTHRLHLFLILKIRSALLKNYVSLRFGTGNRKGRIRKHPRLQILPVEFLEIITHYPRCFVDEQGALGRGITNIANGLAQTVIVKLIMREVVTRATRA